jgi:hypothetical protein
LPQKMTNGDEKACSEHKSHLQTTDACANFALQQDVGSNEVSCVKRPPNQWRSAQKCSR